VGKLTPVRPSAIRALVSSFNFNQAGVASEINALSGDSAGAWSEDTTEALVVDAIEAWSEDITEALVVDATEAFSGDTIERLDTAVSLKSQQSLRITGADDPPLVINQLHFFKPSLKFWCWLFAKYASDIQRIVKRSALIAQHDVV
jgi:hypothetical protein